MVRRLSPRDDVQRSLKAEVLRISLEVGQIRIGIGAGGQFDTGTVSGASSALAQSPVRRLWAFCAPEHHGGDCIVRLCPYGLHGIVSDSRYGSASYGVHETLNRLSATPWR
jgi:hypothetical protein